MSEFLASIFNISYTLIDRSKGQTIGRRIGWRIKQTLFYLFFLLCLCPNNNVHCLQCFSWFFGCLPLCSSVSPAPVNNTPKSAFVSSSLLSDLEGLSLSNVSPTIQVSAPLCVCNTSTPNAISSICVEGPSFHSVWRWQNIRGAGKTRPSPWWKISASDTNYWPFLPANIYGHLGWCNCSARFL